MTHAETPTSSSGGALEGIRVIDLSRVLAGPWCGQTLADLGAEVIKVERPAVGDDTRAWGPPYLRTPEGVDTGESTYYLAANRGKKSITVDLATPDGQAHIRSLVAEADVVLENYKVGQLAKYGLDYESLRHINPSLIYCSITGFGQTGPWAHRAGYDFIIQALSGFMSVTGERDDLPGGGPQKAGVAIADLLTGAWAVIGILSALYHRQRTGAGQHVDLALLDVMVANLANLNTSYLATGQAPVRAGNAHANIVPYQTFTAADGHVVIAVGNDGQFRKLCAVLGDPLLADDPRFSTNPERVRNRDALVPLLADVLATRPRAHWVAALEAVGVPCGPINRLDEVFSNPQVVARGMQITLPHPLAGSVRLVANPLKMSETPPRYDRPPPLLGEHDEPLPQADRDQFDDRR